MTALAVRRSGAGRRVFLTLAMLAVALKVLIPPGFMPGGAGPAERFALVLCTGHGAVTLAADPGKKTPDSKPAHDAPCAFVGHGAAAPPPDLHPIAVADFAPSPEPVAAALRRDLAPGRGLAAPPLPARGPPILLT